MFRLNNITYSGSGFYYYDKPEDLSHGYFITAAHCVISVENDTYYKITVAFIQNPITTQWFKVNVGNIYVYGIADVALIRTDIDLTNHPEYCLKLNTGIVNSGDLCYVVGDPEELTMIQLVQDVLEIQIIAITVDIKLQIAYL